MAIFKESWVKEDQEIHSARYYIVVTWFVLKYRTLTILPIFTIFVVSMLLV